MNARAVIDTALRTRGMMAINPVCPCCGDVLDRDDFPTVDDYTTGPALITRYGSMPCHACTDAHYGCDECGVAIRPDDPAQTLVEGEHYCSTDCEFGDGPDGSTSSTYSVNDAPHHQ